MRGFRGIFDIQGLVRGLLRSSYKKHFMKIFKTCEDTFKTRQYNGPRTSNLSQQKQKHFWSKMIFEHLQEIFENNFFLEKFF